MALTLNPLLSKRRRFPHTMIVHGRLRLTIKTVTQHPDQAAR
jgi:hypothetical protein